jgi:hypothetical protein
MKLSHAAFALIVLTPFLTLAGGSSTVGPGSPHWEYKCNDASENVYVNVGRKYPKYDHDEISAQTTVPMTMTIEKEVQKLVTAKAGGPLVFQGAHLTLTLLATAPLFENGKAFVAGTLKDSSSWEPTRELELKCEVIHNN